MAEFDHWMKFHIGDYLADTMHLSTYQHGIYCLLLFHCFKRGCLPGDRRALMQIAKVTDSRHWNRHAGVVLALFKRIGGELQHPRVDAERAEAKRISDARREAGKNGAEVRWKNTPVGHATSSTAADAVQHLEKQQKPNGKCHATTATKKEKKKNPLTPSAAADGAAHPDADASGDPARHHQPKISRISGTNPRATGSNPRKLGTNPRASISSRLDNNGMCQIARAEIAAKGSGE